MICLAHKISDRPDYVAERHANQPSTEQATQRPAARSAGQGVLQGLQRQNSASRHSDAESAIQHAVTQARLGERFRPGPLPEQKELVGPKIGRSD
ncbi:xanthomonas outer protein AQ [blood disease bacterium A2-HR MARDI]|uniref:Xanthomonas outer protein AQ n=1 Tax=blood disease bacterium A2-HR MARDI TaxID=1944648 RepID=A0A1U9VH21_9RALS|nr:xanthomonas outer protein AQ [blood disease bacterium A2-HR MARDI]